MSGLTDVAARIRASIPEATEAGAKPVLEEAQNLVPKEEGHLAGTGHIDPERGGDNTVGIIFDGPYARWIEEGVEFHHPHGGQAKYLHTAGQTKVGAAAREAADVIKDSYSD